MLVLSRKTGERILIGDNIAVTVVRISQGIVRIGIEAPRDMSVVREEVVIHDTEAPADNSCNRVEINIPEKISPQNPVTF
ncbi:MAG: carbon storage regulator [Thermoguttaceae bacterium]|nr:carbon storage regulator [Thermoguttaceae bacterium]MDO4858503.1 carbon storage regulator [Thermoguttaceae bacterium]